jgi:hypothetical protein
MLTIFTIPKPFEGHIGIIQKNALRSWKRLFSEIEIIVFGDEKGVEEIAKELNIIHIPEISKNRFGTPLISSAFKIAKEKAKNNILVYANTDIVLGKDFIKAIKSIKLESFLMSGRRIDVDVDEAINFNNSNWENDLIERGSMHGYSGIDYLAFPKNLYLDIPDFAVGRPGWDSWFVYYIKSLKVPVIDATNVVRVFHQNHESIYKNKIKENEESFNLAGKGKDMCTLREADFVLTKQGLKKPSLKRIILGKLIMFYPWRVLLSIKRKIRK